MKPTSEDIRRVLIRDSWAAALIACHLRWYEAQDNAGARKLFDAVNEAYCVLWRR